MMDYILLGLQYAGVALFVVFFFGFCIFIHELGHFLVAKWRGLHIIAFSIGFKKIWSFKRNGVEYRIGCIPCGGYVDLPQIDAVGQPKTEDGKLLPRGKPIDRILTAFAGPFFNILFGFFLGTFIWILGIPQDSPKMDELLVAKIEDKQLSPEYKAGLREGDIIYKINGKTFYSTWGEVVKDIIFTVGDVTLDVKKAGTGETKTVIYRPIVNPNKLADEKIAYPFFKPQKPVVVYPLLGSAGAKAGLKDGDEVIEANGQKITDVNELQLVILESNGKPVNLVVMRKDPKTEQIKNVPITVTPTLKEKVFRIGVRPDFSEPVSVNDTYYKFPIQVAVVVKNSVAQQAGLLKDDLVLTIDGQKFDTPNDFFLLIRQSDGNPLKFTIKRGNEILTKTLKPVQEDTFEIGVEFAFINHPNPWQQFMDVIDMSYKSVRGIIYGMLGQSTLGPRHMSGPLGIVRVISTAVYRGSYIQGLYIIVIITFSLAILNLLPIPVLDGGHILLAIIETVIGKPLPARLVQPVTLVFITLLISLMVFVTFYDFKRVIRDFTPPSSDNTMVKQPDTGANAETKANDGSSEPATSPKAAPAP